jgi:Fe-S cluster assembly protein SufD
LDSAPGANAPVTVAAPNTRSTGPEPDWLKELRDRGRSRFDELPVPHHKQKGWEFTDMSSFDPDSFAAAEGGDLATEPAHSPLVVADGHPSVIAVDGAAETRGESIPEGVTVSTLADAIREYPEIVKAHLGSLVLDSDKFAAQNTMSFASGAFVHVQPGVQVAEPVVITALQANAGAMPWRSLIVVEEGAELTLAEQFLSADDELEGYFNPVSEVIVGDGASVSYLCVQDLSERTWVLGSQRTKVGRDASIHWVGLGLGSGQGKLRMETDITGRGANARVTGAYVGHGSQHLDYDTTQEHAAADTTSDLAFRGILRDRARAVWSGMIKVDPGAQHTDAFQENRNLLLSDGAHADAIPGLEIEANDVRCTHAATVARLDADQVFYLMTRGLTRGEAERLLVGGFLEVIAGRLEDSPFLHEIVSAALERELERVLA